MSGGRGKIYGTLIGVLIIAVLNNGLNILWRIILLSGRNQGSGHPDCRTLRPQEIGKQYTAHRNLI